MSPPMRLLAGRRYLAIGIGLVAGIILLIAVNLPSLAWMHALGPLNTGHENLACEECHSEAIGTLRQQIQANARYLVGLTDEPPSLIGHDLVTNEDCLDCHQRPKDRHPVYRFFEPRYAEARSKIQPHLCKSCHQEHHGVRVTKQQTFCKTCHRTLVMKNDPLDTPHAELVAIEDWQSCLGCHDFHGNHKMTLKEKVDEVFRPEQVQAYFEGEASPYSDERLYKAKKTRFKE